MHDWADFGQPAASEGGAALHTRRGRGQGELQGGLCVKGSNLIPLPPWPGHICHMTSSLKNRWNLSYGLGHGLAQYMVHAHLNAFAAVWVRCSINIH